MAQTCYAATRKGLFKIIQKGSSWKIDSVSFLGDNVPMMLPDPRDGSLYAALALGHFGSKIHRSHDGGNTWEEIGVPAYPELAPGEEPVMDPVRQKPLSAKLELIWSLEPGGPDQPGLLWCGTAPGGLFLSKDSGATWNIVTTLWKRPERREWFGGGLDWPGIHSICVDPRDSRRVAIGISCGGVWITPDGGETWRCQSNGMRAEYMPPEQAHNPNVQDPHRLVQCRKQPDHMWVQHHNGIFATTDGAANWRELSDVKPSAFGFAVVVDPNDGKTAWFVPAIKDEKRIPVGGRVVVIRTRDGGKSFQSLDRGLPQDHAYDITFRHGLDISPDGKQLAMGTSTGSLWISEDQGDSWQTVSTNLPQIYSVRFA